MLLACGPLLLLPAGVCVCKLGRSVSKTVATGCCSEHHHSDDEKQPDRPRDDHSPGCPAATAAVERVQWSEPTRDVTGELVPPTPVPVPVPFTRLAIDHFPFRLTPVLDRTSPPLYLSHCALVL